MRRAGETLPTGVGAHTGTVTSSQAPDLLVLSEGPGRVSGRQDGGRTRFDTDVPSANTAVQRRAGDDGEGVMMTSSLPRERAYVSRICLRVCAVLRSEAVTRLDEGGQRRRDFHVACFFPPHSARVKHEHKVALGSSLTLWHKFRPPKSVRSRVEGDGCSFPTYSRYLWGCQHLN